MGIINTLAEQDPLNTIYINSLFPRLMARRCRHSDVKFIHITTDCVFNGKHGRYTEESPHDAHDIYGQTKSLGEPKDCMTLRTSIIGEEKHQYHSLISWAQSQKNKEVKGYTNHHWNGVTTHQYGKIISQIMKENLYKENLFHVFSPSDVTKFELLRILNSRFDLNLTITPHEAQPPIDRTLRTRKRLQKVLSIPSISEQVQQL
ncbi:MAG TPA: NAD-dependent dehydratase [Flavobacteriales bacterium]|nr:NAD-dependent dehydratase [Flavobacteriales bacterium]